MTPAPKKEVPYVPEKIVDVVRVNGQVQGHRTLEQMGEVYRQAVQARLPEGQFVKVFSDIVLTRVAGKKYYI